jgi:hypothetical protein
MKRLIPTIMLVLSAPAFGDAATSKNRLWRPGMYRYSDPQFKALCRDIYQRASGGGRVSYFGGKIAVATTVFDLEKSASYFERAEQKELVAVFHGWDPRMGTAALNNKESEKAVVEKLNRFFFKLGYKRVLILFGWMSSGVRVISDSDVTLETPTETPSEETHDTAEVTDVGKEAAGAELRPTNRAKTSPFPENAIEPIRVVTRTAWEVKVRPDGSGHVGFIKSGAPDSTVFFPSGTLDSEQIRKVLSARAEEVASPTVHVDVVLPRPGQTSASAVRRSVSLSWAESLFREALTSVESKPALFRHYEKEHPVFPRTRRAMPPANSEDDDGSQAETLKNLAYVDMHAADYTTQHPLVCGAEGDFPTGRELAFRQVESKETVHAVFPEGVTPPKTFDGKFVLRGHFQGIQNMDRYKLKKPEKDYRYFVVSSWEHQK